MLNLECEMQLNFLVTNTLILYQLFFPLTIFLSIQAFAAFLLFLYIMIRNLCNICLIVRKLSVSFPALYFYYVEQKYLDWFAIQRKLCKLIVGRGLLLMAC